MNAEGSLLNPIEQRTLADIVTERVRIAIVHGELKGGERLTEPMLAARLRVSRSPVREALYRLRSRGLITGATANYVWKPTIKDVDEIFSLLIALESLAAEWVVKNQCLTEEDFDNLQSMLDHLRYALDEPSPLSSLSLVELDEDFHSYIIESSQHTRLIGWWQQMSSQRRILLHSCVEQHGTIEPAARMIAGHQVVLDALRCGDHQTIQTKSRTIYERRSRRIKEGLQI